MILKKLLLILIFITSCSSTSIDTNRRPASLTLGKCKNLVKSLLGFGSHFTPEQYAKRLDELMKTIPEPEKAERQLMSSLLRANGWNKQVVERLIEEHPDMAKKILFHAEGVNSHKTMYRGVSLRDGQLERNKSSLMWEGSFWATWKIEARNYARPSILFGDDTQGVLFKGQFPKWLMQRKGPIAGAHLLPADIHSDQVTFLTDVGFKTKTGLFKWYTINEAIEKGLIKITD